MKKIESFSTPPPAGFEEFADGAVYRALQGEDYENRRAFLASLTRWAGQNGYVVERVASDEAVEFRFLPAPDAKEGDALVAEAKAAAEEKTADPF